MQLNDSLRNQWNNILGIVFIEGLLIYGIAMDLIEYPGLWYTYPYLILLMVGVIKICLQANTWKEWLLTVGLLTVGYLSWKGSTDRSSLLFMLAVCCCKYIQLEKVVKADICVRIGSLIFRVIFGCVGVLPNNINVIIGGRPRTFFSWGHPNGMGLFFLMLCMDWIYLRHKKMKWFEYIGIVLLVVFLDMTANSRTTELVILVVLVLEGTGWFLWKKGQSDCLFWKLVSVGSLGISVLMPVMGVIICQMFGVARAVTIGTLGDRFMFTYGFLNDHGISLFGKPYTEGTYEYLDILFANCFLYRGIIFGVIVLLLAIVALKVLFKKHDNRYLLILLAMFLFGVAEQEHVNLIYSMFPILLGIPMWEYLEKAGSSRKA